ncbi:hypothetical protein EJ03DRAFT_67427 [Teratosphaeria nubilosa]|uniref:Uncharacterized protein n=1 Tax=Teratosphaeria nubilosa TaxID=161662 RepID=A0A6G1LCR6_9PEZI|nr:hypothetical protein EJ03DRAFT_67427 [Teratosphaeria nubilosa]
MAVHQPRKLHVCNTPAAKALLQFMSRAKPTHTNQCLCAPPMGRHRRNDVARRYGVGSGRRTLQTVRLQRPRRMHATTCQTHHWVLLLYLAVVDLRGKSRCPAWSDATTTVTSCLKSPEPDYLRATASSSVARQVHHGIHGPRQASSYLSPTARTRRSGSSSAPSCR